MYCNISGPSGSLIGRERARSRTATLPLPDKAVGVFCLYDESELGVTPAETDTMEAIQEEPGDTVLENGTVEDRSGDPRGKKDAKSRVQKGQAGNEFSFSNPAFQTDERLDNDSEETVDIVDENSGTKPRSKHTEQIKKDDESNSSNQALISEEKQRTDSDIIRERSQTGGDSKNENLLEERQSNRSDSGRFSEGYASSPETDSVNSIECVHTEKKSQTEKSEKLKEEIYATDYTSSQARPRSLSSRRSHGSSFTKGSDTSYSGISVIIEEVNEQETKSSKTSRTWTDWFKTPMFYKVVKRN